MDIKKEKIVIVKINRSPLPPIYQELYLSEYLHLCALRNKK